jgi:hypothetical protein
MEHLLQGLYCVDAPGDGACIFEFVHVIDVVCSLATEFEENFTEDLLIQRLGFLFVLSDLEHRTEFSNKLIFQSGVSQIVTKEQRRFLAARH